MLGWHCAEDAFAMALAVAIDVAPCVWIYEADLVGRDANHITVLLVQRLHILLRTAAPDGDVVWQSGECGELGTRDICEWMEVYSVDAPNCPLAQELEVVSMMGFEWSSVKTSECMLARTCTYDSDYRTGNLQH